MFGSSGLRQWPLTRAPCHLYTRSHHSWLHMWSRMRGLLCISLPAERESVSPSSPPLTPENPDSIQNIP